MPRGKQIEIIHYEQSYKPPSSSSRMSTTLSPANSARCAEAQHMISVDLADGIRYNAHLRYITFGEHAPYSRATDVFDRVRARIDSGDAQGVISSFIHGGEELIHFRLKWNMISSSYRSSAEGIIINEEEEQEGKKLFNTTEVQEERFQIVPQHIDQHFTDYHGACVPLGVIEAMRRAEGKSKVEWYQRGVEVGEPAWAVLTEWEKGTSESRTASWARTVLTCRCCGLSSTT